MPKENRGNPTKDGDIGRKSMEGLAMLAAAMWLGLFVPAWTLDYWQAWLYWLVFVASVCAITAYFIRRDPALIKSRLTAGAAAEKEGGQKTIQALASICFLLLFIIPSLDHRYFWSAVPAPLSIAGDVFVVLGLLAVFLVFRENAYASGIIEVREGQRVIDTGLYAAVRHPMYSGALLMLFFTPIALGSYWGLLAFFPMLALIAFRAVEEERFLAKSLPGYAEYCQKVRYRLLPLVW